MTWVKLDDRFPTHPKVIGLSDRAFRLHVSAICYCAEHLTDGHVPVGFVSNQRDAEPLVNAALWDVEPGGWVVHDYLAYNPSRAHAEQERSKKQAAGQAGGQARARAHASAASQAKAKPVPVPVPVSKDAESKDTATPSEDTQPTSDQLYLAEKFDLTAAAVKKLNQKHGTVPVLEALRQLSDNPPPGLDKPFGWLDTVAAFKAVSA